MQYLREHGRLGAPRTLALASMAFLSVSLLSFLGGCTVGPKYHQPVALTQAPPPPAYKEIPKPPAPANAAAPSSQAAASQEEALKEWQPAQPSDNMLRGKWWEIYNEPELNALEEQLNIDNQNIKVFFENFMEARAVVREARAQYYPSATIGPTWGRARGSSNLGNNTGTNKAGTTSSLITAPIDVSWEPDLFGRIRNQVHEEQYTAQVSAADLENERLAEQASLASYFFEIRGQDELQVVLNSAVVADKKALDLAQSRYDTGIDTQLSLVEAKATLESAEALATNVALLRAQYEHAITTLIGKSASDFSIPVKPMTAVPPPVPVGVPSQLLERRPDIAAAERNMASANAAIGVAYSAFFPQFTLSASGGFQSSSWKHLFDWPSRTWSLGVGATETISAELEPGLNQYVSIYNADVASYRQTVLTAFQQVEDNLTAVSVYVRQAQQQQEAVNSTQAALNLEMGRYETGIDPYLDVVTLQVSLLDQQQSLVGLQVSQMTSSVQLIEALGGGWDSSQLPTPRQVTQSPSKADTKIVQ
jgi:NodT family efflux transporter outer membrane factor (OMF) lipoprotein